jgi:hypothetical protein
MDEISTQTRKVIGMEDASAGQLKRVIETQHGVASALVKSVRVHRATANQTDWDGVVHVFDLKDHPKASRAFAWSSRIVGGAQPRYFAVLQTSQIATPAQAVKAASAAIRKWGAKGTHQ